MGHPSTLKMQGMSFLVAWITSEAITELTDRSSSLNTEVLHVQRRHTLGAAQMPLPLPEVQNKTGHYPRLGGLPLWDIVEK